MCCAAAIIRLPASEEPESSIRSRDVWGPVVYFFVCLLEVAVIRARGLGFRAFARGAL